MVGSTPSLSITHSQEHSRDPTHGSPKRNGIKSMPSLHTQQPQTAIAPVLGVLKTTITRGVRRDRGSGAPVPSKPTAGPSSDGQPTANRELTPPSGVRSTPTFERTGVLNKFVAGANGRRPTPPAMNGFIGISSTTKPRAAISTSICEGAIHMGGAANSSTE